MKDLHFIEVGTSDFDTLIQVAKPETAGISIEPIKYYLDRLPNPPNVIKMNCAIALDGTVGKNKIYYVPDEVIKANNLPHWIRGCNSLGDYHYQHKQMDIKHLVQIDEVDQIPLSDILEQQDIRRILTLKIDTEGGDCAILQSFVPYLNSKPRIKWPGRILFETNILTPEKIIQETLDIYTELGYNYKRDHENTLMIL